MSEKREEFIATLRNGNKNDDGGNAFFAARLESERIEREKIRTAQIESLPDKANVFLSKKIDAELERRAAERYGK